MKGIFVSSPLPKILVEKKLQEKRERKLILFAVKVAVFLLLMDCI